MLESLSLLRQQPSFRKSLVHRMPLLYYWRGDNYRRDLDLGAGYHLNQGNRLLHEIDLGDSLWGFTRRKDGAYALAVELVISAKTFNPRGYRYGRYRVWGNLNRSRYFCVERQPDIKQLIHQLSIHAQADVLGRSFQGHAAVRRMTPEDHRLLAAYATRLPLEPRARLIPEERLEALIFAGDEAAVSALMQSEPWGIAEERRRYLTTSAVARDPKHVAVLQGMYDGQCQICSWAPKKMYRHELCEAHHVRWLSRGGKDSISNLVLICPNHHRAIHRCDAPFDWEKNAFIFQDNEETLILLNHELTA